MTEKQMIAIYIYIFFYSYNQFFEYLVIQKLLHNTVCVYPPPRILITGGVIWHDMDPI